MSQSHCLNIANCYKELPLLLLVLPTKATSIIIIIIITNTGNPVKVLDEESDWLIELMNESVLSADFVTILLCLFFAQVS